MREQGKQLLESFRQDTFAPDPNPAVFSRDRVEHGVAKMIDLAETALPMLTPDQRAIAAAKIRAGGGHF
jgi:hypothetical protein